MAKKAKKKPAKKAAGGNMIISKSRTKASVKKCNVSGDFYGALDRKVREIINQAESRAIGNKRKTLRPHDL
jgi:histone H3/H4